MRETAPAGRIWAVFEPRSATACRRVFQEAFAEALALADTVVVGAVYRSTLPEAERLSAPQLAADVSAAGVAARHLDSVDEIVNVVGREAQDGDLIVVMSNGDFGGVHERLLDRLDGRA
jgi:UDP-N-acetylmuramate: L-alanyl-gamma-D-glutamyl-meso-diaminopimelate ligase